MALTTFNHFDDIFNRDIDRIFSHWMGNRCPLTVRNYPNTLSVDMRDTGDEYEVKVDLPGVDRENIAVTVENGMLNISAERQNTIEEGGEKDRYYFAERTYGSVSRSVKLPKNASEEGVQAKYENGVLTLRLSKDEGTKRRTIDIQ